ncbi:MAG: hypothetical protein O2887_12780 [Bacteroidetes bacterium]|nr:hypothetical protein [Bacteroidota bacterium]
MQTSLLRFIFGTFFLLTSFLSIGQTKDMSQTKEAIEAKFDQIAAHWNLLSAELDNYEGLSAYCTSNEYRMEVLVVLNEIHHFDSLIMDKVKAPNFKHENQREERKTLQNIAEFESEYSLKNFVEKLSQECEDRKDIEKHKKETINEIGSDSYGGQKLVVELDLYKFIHHVTKRLDHIETHLHRLHIDES